MILVAMDPPRSSVICEALSGPPPVHLLAWNPLGRAEAHSAQPPSYCIEVPKCTLIVACSSCSWSGWLTVLTHKPQSTRRLAVLSAATVDRRALCPVAGLPPLLCRRASPAEVAARSIARLIEVYSVGIRRAVCATLARCRGPTLVVEEQQGRVRLHARDAVIAVSASETTGEWVLEVRECTPRLTPLRCSE